MAYIRKFKTAAGTTGVQVCWKERGKVVKTVHIGTASGAARLETLTKMAQDVIDADKNPLFDLSRFDSGSFPQR